VLAVLRIMQLKKDCWIISWYFGILVEFGLSIKKEMIRYAMQSRTSGGNTELPEQKSIIGVGMAPVKVIK
tara:strand:+ start:35889 stop:36098 length:210 start_codon:yes stop_codon:yes gene_type:complete